MRYRYYLCDVFTDTRFGGNQLAVLPQAAGLSAERMQQVAREFNFSETTFVFPPEEAEHTAQVRIFTPVAEVPFAGHPNIGTAFVLATTGRLGAINTALSVTFEERAGLVPITIRRRAGPVGLVRADRPGAPVAGQDRRCRNDGGDAVPDHERYRDPDPSAASRLGWPAVPLC